MFVWGQVNPFTPENFQMTYMSFENLTKQITVNFGLSSNRIALFHPFPQVGYHLNPFFRMSESVLTKGATANLHSRADLLQRNG